MLVERACRNQQTSGTQSEDAERLEVDVAAQVFDLYHIVPCLNKFEGCEMKGDTGFLAHLEVQIKFTDDLGPVWAVNGYGVDREVGSFEGPSRGCLGCDHEWKGNVPWLLSRYRVMMHELPVMFLGLKVLGLVVFFFIWFRPDAGEHCKNCSD